MTDANMSIPKITDEDIEWVRNVMNLDYFDEARRQFVMAPFTVDLAACPGSGKTTLIVAKLAILAQKWPHRTRGICVLSHTNVAREQIQRRLGRTVVGEKLLSYPHFVDTIHGFVNRFLALPWLYSNGYPAPTIDDDLTTRFRRRVLGEPGYRAVQSFLERKYLSWEMLRVKDRHLDFEINGKVFPANPSTKSYQRAKEAIEGAAREGYFCYDEIFVWGNALLEDQPHIPIWLAHRFPLVIIDEMQDTSETQADLLRAAFPRKGELPVVVRVGDPNQEIFDLLGARTNIADPFPDSEHCMEVPTSLRFGSEIASLASPFAVREVGENGLCGIGPRESGSDSYDKKHAIFLFPDDNVDGVLEAYARHSLDVLGDRAISDGPIAAIGHIHRRDGNVSPGHAHFPKSVSDYWEGYNPEMGKKDAHPRTFAQYIWLAQGLVSDTGMVGLGVEKIAAGTLRLARQMGDVGELKRRARKHVAILGILEQEPAALASYRGLFERFLVSRETLSKENWPGIARDMVYVSAVLCSGSVDEGGARAFLEWPP